MKITFDESAVGTILRVFGMDVDGDGYVIDEETGDHVTDGYGTPIEGSEVGGLIPLEEHGFDVNDNGITVDSDGEQVAPLVGDKDGIVPYTYEDDGEKLGGLVRDNFVVLSSYVSKSELEGEDDDRVTGELDPAAPENTVN